MAHECWTSQGSLSCSPWQSVCHNWTATVATHICMLGCESILAVTARWLISVCGFCLCGIRRWKSHVWCFLETRVFNLLQGCLVERAGPIPWPGRSCDFTLLDFFWSNVTEHIYIYIFHHLSFSCWKYTEIEHVLSHAIFWYCAQYKVVIPFWHFGITNWSCLQGSRCSSRTCLGSRQLARTGCLLEELTVTERTIGSWFSGET